MDDHAGMSTIVKVVCRFLLGIVLVYGLALTLTGHLSPGGGFAGGVVFACAFVLSVLALGGDSPPARLMKRLASGLEAGGALLFLAAAALGYLSGTFFTRFLPTGPAFTVESAPSIVWMNLAIFLKVGAGIFAGFLALVLFDRRAGGEGRER